MSTETRPEKSNELPYLVIITGTHSAGKTTLLNALAGIDFTQPTQFVPEAATDYTSRLGKHNVTTDGYTFADQIGIEVHALSLIASAMDDIMTRAANTPESRGLVVADRSMIDGAVYSRLRTPDADTDTLSMFDIEHAIDDSSFNTVAGVRLPFRTLAASFLRRYCSLVLVANHEEVELEDNGLRDADSDFRDIVATNIVEAYSKLLDARKVKSVQGTPAGRKRLAQDYIQELLETPEPI